MIISASRRTDMPGHYGEWLLNRLRDGYCLVPNPFRPSLVSRMSLNKSDVDALVLWTKHPASLLDRLGELNSFSIPCCFLYTINDYPKILEPGLPPLADRLDAFRRLSGMYGKSAVTWRYDPIVLSPVTDSDYHKSRFATIAQHLEGYTDRVIVSLLDVYRKTCRRLRMLEERGFAVEYVQREDPRLGELLAYMATMAENAGMRITSCAEGDSWGKWGIEPLGCIDAEIIGKIAGVQLTSVKDKGQRENCLCTVSKDIGMTDCCPFGCEYCYANRSQEYSLSNFAQHNPNSPMLFER